MSNESIGVGSAFDPKGDNETPAPKKPGKKARFKDARIVSFLFGGNHAEMLDYLTVKMQEYDPKATKSDVIRGMLEEAYHVTKEAEGNNNA